MRFTNRNTGLLVVAACLLSACGAHGEDTFWQDAAGDWFTGSWSAGVPGDDDVAKVYNGGAISLNGAGAVADYLFLGESNSGELTVGASGDLAIGRSLRVGYYGTGLCTLNGGAITVTNPTAVSYIGFQSAVSGAVVQTSGLMSMPYLYLGQNGIGTYTISGGELRLTGTSSSYEQHIGRLAGSEGTLEQNGGLVRVTTRQLRMGEAGTGTYNLNAGTGVVETSIMRVGYNGRGTVNANGGTLLVTNSYIYVGYNELGTGVVAQSAGTVESGAHLYVGYEGEGHYELDGGDLTVGGELQIGYGNSGWRAQGYYEQNGGTCTVMGGECRMGELLAGTGRLVMNDGVLDMDSNGRLLVGTAGTGTLEVTGGVITNVGYFQSSYYPSATSRVVQTGGKLYINNSTFFGRNGPCTVHLDGGLMQLPPGSVSHYWGGHNTYAATGQCTFIQTSGTFDVAGTGDYDLNLGDNAGSVGICEIRGGSFLATNSIFRLDGTASVFRVVGSAATVAISRFYSSYPDTAALNFVLDKGTNHISTIWAVSTACRVSGTLDIDALGGVVMLRTNRLDLLNPAGYSSTGGFVYAPPSELWSHGWAPNAYGSRDPYRITLATGGGSWNMGTVDLDGTTALSFAAQGAGYVQVNNVDTNGAYRGVLVRLKADPGSGTLADLVAFMQDSGYRDVREEAIGGYDILVGIAPEDVQEGAAGPSYFLWDLTDFDATATVSGIKILEDRPTGSLVIVK